MDQKEKQTLSGLMLDVGGNIHLEISQEPERFIEIKLNRGF